MSDLFVYQQPVAYEFSCLPDTHPGRWHFTIRVERRGPGAWAVVRPSGFVLSREGTWDFEPQPSSRTDEWIAANRFRYHEAFLLAEQWAPKLTVMGHTVEDALAPDGWHG